MVPRGNVGGENHPGVDLVGGWARWKNRRPLKWSAGLSGVGLEPSVDSATSDVLDGPPRGAPGAGGSGSRAVLEVRSREVPFILEHGQIVGRLVYEKMLARPKTLYGSGIGSNYQAQGLKLSKHFRAE